MSEKLEPGDLCHIVFGCCADTRSGIGTVVRIKKVAEEAAYCNKCGHEVAPGQAWELADRNKQFAVTPTPWLRKIKPPGKQEESEREAEREIS